MGKRSQDILERIRYYSSTIDEINSKTKISSHLNSDYFTLYHKLGVVLGNLHKRFILNQCRTKVHRLFEFCLMTDYETTGQISKYMQINANECYKGKLEKQFIAWREFKKLGKDNPFYKFKMECPTRENCHAKYKELFGKQTMFDELSQYIEMIIDLQKNFLILADVSPLDAIQTEDAETIKSLSRYDCDCKTVMRDDDIDVVLQEKIRHFDLVVPQLLVKCLGCGSDFGRLNIPIHFDCGHAMCDKCELKRIENLDLKETCCRCWAVKSKTCPICNIITFRTIHNQIPIGITVSDLYPTLTLGHHRQLYKNCNIHKIGESTQDRRKHPTGCKIPKIVELILNLLAFPLLQADGTNYLQPVDHRKILVFDSDPNFRTALVEALKYQHSVVYLLENDHNILEKFKSTPKSAVLILDVIHTPGVHLVEADTVILCSPSEDPSVEMQAIGRAHRFGQKRPVSVYHCYIENSIEKEHLLVEFDQDDEDCIALHDEKHEDKKALDVDVELKILQEDYYHDEEKPREVIEIHDDVPATKKPIEKPAAVQSMLQELQLEEHWQAFQMEKYEWLEDLSELSHLDLDRLNVPRGRRGRIFNFLDLRGVKRQKLQ